MASPRADEFVTTITLQSARERNRDTAIDPGKCSSTFCIQSTHARARPPPHLLRHILVFINLDTRQRDSRLGDAPGC